MPEVLVAFAGTVKGRCFLVIVAEVTCHSLLTKKCQQSYSGTTPPSLLLILDRKCSVKLLSRKPVHSQKFCKCISPDITIISGLLLLFIQLFLRGEKGRERSKGRKTPNGGLELIVDNSPRWPSSLFDFIS